jgi:hypothetical protein
MPLMRLIYYSRNLIPGSPEEVASEIRGILDVSVRNNARCGVTGALLFNRGCFAQVLEGRQGDVEATFERIQCDPRHSDVQVLQFDRVAERGFGSWSMAFVGADMIDATRYSDLARDDALADKQIGADRVFSILLQTLRREELV